MEDRFFQSSSPSTMIVTNTPAADLAPHQPGLLLPLRSLPLRRPRHQAPPRLCRDSFVLSLSYPFLTSYFLRPSLLFRFFAILDPNAI
ncbi:hypothetical protein NL676_007229 [Syzygium grande]|nr:hypothetical protein NL676_007229 [Syzygium grande]